MKLSNITWKLLLVGCLTSPVACVADGGESLQILRNQRPASECIIPATSSGEYQTSGRIDIASTQGYLFTPLVQNVAVSNDNSMKRIFMEGANVDIEFLQENPPVVSAGVESSLSFRNPFSGSVEAGGLATFDFIVVPKPLLDDLADDVSPGNSVFLSANVTIVADLDGDTIESNTFKYPVEICDGCMTNVLGPCVGLVASDINDGGNCNVYQDGILDCCTAEDGSLTCPAVAIVPDPV